MIVATLIKDLKEKNPEGGNEVYIKIGNIYYPVRSTYEKELDGETIYVISAGIFHLNQESE